MYGDFRKYNDYELLYLVKIHVEEAKEILFWKYSFLIKSRIYKMGVPQYLWDDYYQEGCLMLHKAIRIYDESSPMTFTGFFELLLKRKIITLLKKDLRKILTEQYDDFEDFPDVENQDMLLNESDVDDFKFAELEKIAYIRLIVQQEKVEDVSEELKISNRSLYNAKQRALKKIRNKINK